MHYSRLRRHGDVHTVKPSKGGNNKTHGMSGTPIYNTWVNIKARCDINTKHPIYIKYYKNRGITICGRWKNSFEGFFEDMGLPPSESHSLDRIDNDKGYSKQNCRWATRFEQQGNMRSNRLVTHDGETHCINEWARRTGIKSATIIGRLNDGWPIKKALTKPVNLAMSRPKSYTP